MKIRVILALMLLVVFLSGAGMVGAETMNAPTRQADETPDCLGQRLVGEYDYELLGVASAVVKDGDVVQSVICNYRMSTKASFPAGAGLISGMAITIDFACPAETEANWKGKTQNRTDAISSSPNSMLLRDIGQFTGYSGDHTIQEKMFLLIDTHTNATIVVNTDAVPGLDNSPIYSAATGQPIATDLASFYAPRANDPVCGRPPGGGGSSTSSPGGSTQQSGEPGHNPWHEIPVTSAVAVAVGAGAIVVLAVGGFVTGAGGLGTSIPAGSTGTAGSAGNAGGAGGSSWMGVPAPSSFAPPPIAPPMSPLTASSEVGTQAMQSTGVGSPQGVAAPVADTQPSIVADNPQMNMPADASQLQPQSASVPAESAPQVVEPAPAVSPVAAVPAVAPSMPSIVQPAIEAAETVLAVGGAVAQASSMSRASSESSGSDQGGSEEGDEAEIEKRCPEAEAYLFGLPAVNSRSDCPGIRPDMGPWEAGIDFTSKDENDVVTKLEFDACVSGVVSYVGGPFNMIEVKRENGNRVQFLHASAVYVEVGNEVESNTKLGVTGGTGPGGPDQYEVHLHVQAIDEHGNMIDPDCTISGGENRELKIKGSESPYRERIEHEADSGADTYVEVIEPTNIVQVDEDESVDSALAIPVIEVVPAVEAVPAVAGETTVLLDAMPDEGPKTTANLGQPEEVEPAAEAIPTVELEPVSEPAPSTVPLDSTVPLGEMESITASPVDDELKQCSNCGKMNPSQAKFCSNCGEPFAQ